MLIKETKILCLIENGFEDLEMWYPVIRLREEGAVVKLASIEESREYIGKHGVPAVSDISFKDVNDKDYQGIIIPGGWAPDRLRRYPEVLKMVRDMDKDKKPIGQICHAGWVLISAGILNGKNVTSTIAIKDDMENAGAKWYDKPVVVDGNIVSSRKPEDLPYYMKSYIEVLKRYISK